MRIFVCICVFLDLHIYVYHYVTSTSLSKFMSKSMFRPMSEVCLSKQQSIYVCINYSCMSLVEYCIRMSARVLSTESSTAYVYTDACDCLS